MATQVYFNGKIRTLPGAYATITSGESSATRNLDYGTVLLIDTGAFYGGGFGFGGGSGIAGVNKQGKDAVYVFDDITSFRDFVKGGMLYKCAEALFTPDPNNAEAVGASRLLYARAAQTAPATLTITTHANKTITIKTIDEGLVANGILTGTHLDSGYAYTIEAGTDDPSAFVVKFWRGTWAGSYTDPVTNVAVPIGEIPIEQCDPVIVCESPECATVKDFLDWCNSDENFGARFLFGTSNADDDDTLDAVATYQCAAGGTEVYSEARLTELLTAVIDVDYSIVMTDRIGADVLGSWNAKVIAHRNQQAKFDKFVFLGAYDTKTNFAQSLAAAQTANSPYVCIVHGGIGKSSDLLASGTIWWDVFYNLCQIVGRTCGKPPYIPLTNKTVGGDKLRHIPDEKEMVKAINAGLIIVYPNPYLGRFVILQAVTTLQDNKVLFNRKGQSFSLQFMRILAQLNKEAVVNAEIDLLGDENGVNINTLSKGSLETWTINFLQQRVATDNQDNLIAGFQNVVAKRIEDYYDVTYEVLVNSEVTKIFFTGFLLKG